MNIVNSNTYNNTIYKAIVVNDNYQEDPENEARVQIFIPDLQYELSDIYIGYMNAANKSSTGNMDKFPWAKSLVADLMIGNIVFGNFIDNNYSQFIILGLDAYNVINEKEKSNGVGGAYDISGDELLDRCCAIVISNEVGIEPNQYPKRISDNYYTSINPNDNGSWSIGLLQWHSFNAFNLLKYIADNVSNWQTSWSNTGLFLYQDIKNKKALNYNYNSFILTEGSEEYNSVKKMLGLKDSKIAQLSYAKNDIYQLIQELQVNYSITDAAVIIWMVDLMNQYGSGISTVKSRAREICNSQSGIAALDTLVSWCENNLPAYNLYKSRREKTRAYVRELESIGKLRNGGLTDEGGHSGNADTTPVIVGSGSYSMPFAGSYPITLGYGVKYSSRNSYHRGIDFGVPSGTPLYACIDGTIESFDSSGSVKYSGNDYYWYGHFCVIHASDGHYVLYAHMTRTAGLSGSITKGTYIGISGSTGNSTGPHLHFEVRTSISYGTDINPSSLLGI